MVAIDGGAEVGDAVTSFTSMLDRWDTMRVDGRRW